VWQTEAGKVSYLLRLPHRGRFLERPLERWPYPPQSGLRHGLGARSPQGRQGPVRVRAHPCHGTVTRSSHGPAGVGPPPQWCEGRQPARKPGTLDPPTTGRDPRIRCDRLGTRNTRPVHGGHGHHQQCSGSSVSSRATSCPGIDIRPARRVAETTDQRGPTRGGGGDRTRVLQYITRASPGAACSRFLSPGGLAGEPPPDSVAVRCPAYPRDRDERWILLADARHRAGGAPGLTTSNSR
jgi:hypothetical protein